VQYIERFNVFFYLPEAVRNCKAFQEYLTHLYTYLADFFQRTNPLLQWHKVQADIMTDFRAAVSSGVVKIKGATGAGAGIGPQL
jgi:hypothetical protein